MIDILIVDDDEVYNEYLGVLLKRSGYSFRSATSGEEVLTFFKKGMFKILILDLGLTGMHGVELCVELRKIDIDVPIYALTGYGEVFDDIAPQVAGFTGAYSKSNLEKLLSKIDVVLNNWNKS